jgi:cell division protein FtsW
MASTIIFVIGFQAFLNMGVVLGVLPTKGLNLPFISYGGSSMVANLVALGLIIATLKILPSEIKNQNSPSSTNQLKSIKSAWS